MYITKTLESAIHDGSTYHNTIIAKNALREAMGVIEALSQGPDVKQILSSLQDPKGMTISRAMECLQGIAAGTFTKDWLP